MNAGLIEKPQGFNFSNKTPTNTQAALKPVISTHWYLPT
jgi:hypothetical protein